MRLRIQLINAMKALAGRGASSPGKCSCIRFTLRFIDSMDVTGPIQSFPVGPPQSVTSAVERKFCKKFVASLAGSW